MRGLIILVSDLCQPFYFLFVLIQGPVVQSIISLTSPLRGQLVKCITTL